MAHITIMLIGDMKRQFGLERRRGQALQESKRPCAWFRMRAPHPDWEFRGKRAEDAGLGLSQSATFCTQKLQGQTFLPSSVGVKTRIASGILKKLSFHEGRYFSNWSR